MLSVSIPVEGTASRDKKNGGRRRAGHGCTASVLRDRRARRWRVPRASRRSGCAVERNLVVDDSYAEKVKHVGLRSYVENLIDNTITKNISDTYLRMQNNSNTIFRDSALELAMERLDTQEIWL